MPNRGHRPARTCVACRREGLKADLTRLVRAQDGSVVVDMTGSAPGRGAYLHRDPDCIAGARKRRHIERSLGATTSEELWVRLTASV